jgi:hypothetical protein
MMEEDDLKSKILNHKSLNPVAVSDSIHPLNSNWEFWYYKRPVRDQNQNKNEVKDV